MTSYVTPKNGSAFIFYVALVDQSNTKLMKSSPTLATGDVKISIDGAALADITTLPTVTPAAGRRVKVSLSAAEMTGDNIGVLFSDASGAEWCDLFINIQTSARQIDELSYPATSGRSTAIDASGQVTVGAIAANAITATSIAADAITAAKVADGTIDAATFASGAINAAAIATDAITAAKIAADAIGASELAADAVTEIQSGLSTLNAAGVRTAVGLASANLDTQLDALPTNAELATALGAADDATLAAIVTAQADLDDIQTRLPAALVGGRIDASIGAAAANTLTASALATDAVTEIQIGLATAASIVTLQASVDDLPTNAELATSQAAADDATLAAIAALTIPTVSDILAGVVEGSITLKGAMRLMLAVLAGKSTGGGTATLTFRDVADAKARVTATVTADGNRTAITRDITD